MHVTQTLLPSTILKLGVVASLVAALIKFWPSDRWHLIAVVAYFPAVLNFCASFFALILLRKSRSWMLVALIPTLLSLFSFVHENPRLLHSTGPTTSAPGSIRIFQWNVWASRNGVPEIAAEIKSQQPAIICLNEPKSTRKDPKFPDYEPQLGGSWYKIAKWNILILSRFALHSIDNVKLPAMQGLYVKVDSNPPFTLLFVDVAANAEVFRRPVLQNFRSYLIENGGFPDVLNGDWNTPVDSYSLQSSLGNYYYDAYREAGNFIGYTWPVWIPFLRIDYTLIHNNHGKVLAYRSGYSTLSDHRWQWIDYVPQTKVPAPQKYAHRHDEGKLLLRSLETTR